MYAAGFRSSVCYARYAVCRSFNRIYPPDDACVVTTQYNARAPRCGSSATDGSHLTFMRWDRAPGGIVFQPFSLRWAGALVALRRDAFRAQYSPSVRFSALRERLVAAFYSPGCVAPFRYRLRFRFHRPAINVTARVSGLNIDLFAFYRHSLLFCAPYLRICLPPFALPRRICRAYAAIASSLFLSAGCRTTPGAFHRLRCRARSSFITLARFLLYFGAWFTSFLLYLIFAPPSSRYNTFSAARIAFILTSRRWQFSSVSLLAHD